MAALTVEAEGDCVIQPTFPIVGSVQVGAKAEDDAYFFPMKGGVLHDRPAVLNNLYCGFGAWVQFMDVSERAQGGGLTMRVEDTSNMSKRYELRKMSGHDPFEFNRYAGISNFFAPFEADADRSAMAVHYQPWEMKAGELLSFPETVIAVHTGDSREAANGYLVWVKTWYPADPPTPEWLRQTFIHRTMYTDSFINPDGAYKTENLIGYEDAVRILGWWTHCDDRIDYFLRVDY